MGFKGGVCPDYEIRAGDFLFRRPLRRQPLLDLRAAPAPFPQAFELRGGATGHTNNGVKKGFGPGFKQERYNHRAPGTTGYAPPFYLRLPDLANLRVENSLQFGALRRVRKDAPGQFLSIQGAIRRDDRRAKDAGNFGQGGWPGSTNCRAMRSVSATAIPCFSSKAPEVDLPIPTPPVMPKSFMCLGRGSAGGFGRLLGQLNDAIEPLRSIRDGIGKDKGAGVGGDRRPGNQIARSLDPIVLSRISNNAQLQ